MRDAIDLRTPKLLRWLTRSVNWKEEVRDIRHNAPVHDTVKERFKFPSVAQCASFGSYRPNALANQDEFEDFYSRPDR
ncbi:hypothetical protein MJC1_01375 [Methylocystis sp. MJC1]|nr:hypothetical protein MJC1_01375 [Methylocystis sp. MJC1]